MDYTQSQLVKLAIEYDLYRTLTEQKERAIGMGYEFPETLQGCLDLLDAGMILAEKVLFVNEVKELLESRNLDKAIEVYKLMPESELRIHLFMGCIEPIQHEEKEQMVAGNLLGLMKKYGTR
jgi:hypothetical protein